MHDVSANLFSEVREYGRVQPLLPTTTLTDHEQAFALQLLVRLSSYHLFGEVPHPSSKLFITALLV